MAPGRGQVSDLNQRIYKPIAEWRQKPPVGDFPNVFVDGLWLKRSRGPRGEERVSAGGDCCFAERLFVTLADSAGRLSNGQNQNSAESISCRTMRHAPNSANSTAM